jgi:hypothetical protein
MKTVLAAVCLEEPLAPEPRYLPSWFAGVGVLGGGNVALILVALTLERVRSDCVVLADGVRVWSREEEVETPGVCSSSNSRGSIVRFTGSYRPLDGVLAWNAKEEVVCAVCTV